MFYPKRNEKELTKELFEKPTSEYRGAPFWAWNCKLDGDEMLRQIDIFQKMGMGGFHMHVRTGMASPYLDSDFMSKIRLCVEEAKKRNMKAYLYDEDRWPSGSAGGLVTKDERFVMRNLLITPTPYASKEKTEAEEINTVQSDGGRGGERTEKGVFVAAYDIVLNEDGTLKNYKRIDENEVASGTKWYLYNEKALPSPWFNNTPYVNTLDKKAIERFIEVTHEKYYAEFGEYFGKTIPSIFTDEPQFSAKRNLSFAKETKDLFEPWTDDMPEKFKEYTGLDLLEGFPEVLWDLPDGKPSYFRYKYHDFISELFAQSYCDTLGEWCYKHNIMLAGHLMMEDTLRSQTMYCGDAMRCYRAFKDLPGMDLLCDRKEYNTVIQCRSVLHQNGGTGVLSELYGVSGWDFDFRGHKLQGDWQAALGVTLRVPHLTWMSMKGEAKRDYPATIGYQSPWWEEYNKIEDHFARVNTALTRGRPMVNIGVIHPLESYWLMWGPSDQTNDIRAQLENNHRMFSETMIFSMLEYDFISESLLPGQCKVGGAPLNVGLMDYDTVIVPGCITLRSTTIERLEKFKEQGGNLIFLGECPKFVDAKPSDRPKKLYEISKKIPYNAADIVSALEDRRFADVRVLRTRGGVAFDQPAGTMSNDMICQTRKDGDYIWFFLCHAKAPLCKDVDALRTYSVSFNGEYSVELYDTMTGEINKVPASYENGKTVIKRNIYMTDSLLFKLSKGRNEGALPLQTELDEGRIIYTRVPVEFSEPNAFLLDMAEYSFDGGEIFPEEEFLRLDNICRSKIGIPPRKKAICQPYLVKETPITHYINLKMNIPSEIEYSGAKLALEDADVSEITWNGQKVKSVIDGWYVDKCLTTVELPKIKVGMNVLEVKVPLGERTNLEYMYLLGSFGVRIDGRIKTIVKGVTELAFGDIVTQGMPFYTGNITYKVPVNVGDNGKLSVKCGQYRGALIGVSVDGQRKGSIIYSPYCLDICGLSKGKHTLELKLFGTRQNGFAQLHHTTGIYFYQSPDSWRSKGDLWTYEYQIKKAGITSSPLIKE